MAAMIASLKPRIVIVPGNGCTPIHEANWYAQMKEACLASDLFSEVVMPEYEMPDPYGAKETIWVPFILDELKADANTILIGHSSGAEAAMRLLEEHALFGCILVCACHTDLGEPNEASAGYYARPWQWEAIRANSGFILQYHSIDDPFIPQEEANHVASSLGLPLIDVGEGGGGAPAFGDKGGYKLFKRKQHFFSSRDVLPLVLQDVAEMLRRRQGQPPPAEAAAVEVAEVSIEGDGSVA